MASGVIVVIASHAPSLTRFRGKLLEAMVERGHRVVAVAPNFDSRLIASLSEIGVEVRSVPMARAASVGGFCVG